MPIAAIQRNRMRGWLTVVGRNLRWRLEDIDAAATGKLFAGASVLRTLPQCFQWRYVARCKSLLCRQWQQAYAPFAGPELPYQRGRGRLCPEFLKEVGRQCGLDACATQPVLRSAGERIGGALNVELIAPPFDGLTTVDGGGHLDKNGAKIFTSYLARELVKTNAFRRAFAGRLGDPQ